MESPRDLLVAWLHDPPDKPLRIRGHEARAARYLSAALSDTVSPEEIRRHEGDHRASATERLPVPHWQAADQQTLIGPDQMLIHHPLSTAANDACGITLPQDVDEDEITDTIHRLIEQIDSTADRFWILWRFLPEYLEHRRSGFTLLPADTRIPDHSIWQHLDTTAAMHVAYGGRQAPAFLSFSVGPVQSFIASARSVRDLWSGSMILSWLVMQAMVPILEQCGPAAIVYPGIRGNPLLDLWLRRRGALRERVTVPSRAARKIPCLPNRFLALVPGTEASALAEQIESAGRAAWTALADRVHARLAKRLQALDPQWDRHWRRPIEDQFDFRAFVLPWEEAPDETLAGLLAGKPAFADAFPETERVRGLADAIPEPDRPRGQGRVVGQWQHRLELLGRISEADKSVRPTPRPAAIEVGERVPPMCGLTGTTEQIGPPRLADAADFWDEATEELQFGGVRLRPGERLGPVALTKRFSGPLHFAEALEFEDARELRFDDTATIAAAQWLKAARQADPGFRESFEAARRDGTWSGQWLHQTERDGDDDDCPRELAQAIGRLRRRDEFSAPPSYYAVLVMDGDELGKWLQGRKSPKVSELIHPNLRDYFEHHAGSPPGLDAPRPVTPAFHASLSQALSNFALHFVPEIVRRHDGTLIYAGGDDVLALLPTATALECAAELYQTYRKEWVRDRNGIVRMLMGSRATLSAGIAVVHYKDDLRRALERARSAEKAAKQSGRDVLQIAAARRSGEASSALCPWPFLSVVQSWVRAFQMGASDRWSYQLRRMVDTLATLPLEAITAMIDRQLARADEQTRRLLGADSGDSNGDISRHFSQYAQRTENRLEKHDRLRHFVTLCQTAAFLARGTDR